MVQSQSGVVVKEIQPTGVPTVAQWVKNLISRRMWV